MDSLRGGAWATFPWGLVGRPGAEAPQHCSSCPRARQRTRGVLGRRPHRQLRRSFGARPASLVLQGAGLGLGPEAADWPWRCVSAAAPAQKGSLGTGATAGPQGHAASGREEVSSPPAAWTIRRPGPWHIWPTWVPGGGTDTCGSCGAWLGLTAMGWKRGAPAPWPTEAHRWQVGSRLAVPAPPTPSRWAAPGQAGLEAPVG